MLTEKAREALRALFPRGQVFTDAASLVAYELDAGLDRGCPQAVVLPRSTEDVARLVRWAAEYEVPLVARGAGTGLSGGAVADRGGVIVAFSHMDHILDVDAYGRSAVAEPCVINLRLDERVREYGLYFPPDPASQRASTIGGNVAENSGGPHCFKYGVTTNYVMGMDVVLADGRRVCIGGRALDYPTYDLCGLLTGSEGMLALITAITVRLVRNPPAVKTMLAIFDSIEQAGVAVSAVIAAGLVPATMEMMDQKIIRIVEPFAHAGLPTEAEAALIIEVDGYPESLDLQVSEIATIMQAHGAHGLRVASSEEERNAIWLARKSAAGAITRMTPSYYTVDVTVPRSRLAETLGEINLLLDRYRLQAGHVFHAGDGNLHPLILVADPKDRDLMERVHNASWEMVEMVVRKDGSLSGEHGIGIEKREYMPLMFNDAELSAMLDVKQVFDPLNLLNPGKIFPSPAANGSNVDTTSNIVHPVVQMSDMPQEVFTPASAEEAAQGLRALGAAGKHVQITGAEIAEVTEAQAEKCRADVILSTTKLRGIRTYAPDDLYVTVGAGTPLSELQAFLASDHKQVPLVSPWPEATIGALVAANVNAPLRMRYGSLRDLVLCANVVLGDGRIIRAGRPVIKNVAGFDLTKVFAGSHGTLGLLTDLTLKITVPPRARRTLLLPIADLRHGLIWARQMLPQSLVASAIVLLRGTPAYLSQVIGPAFPTLANGNNSLLAYTAEGLPEDVQAELAAVRQFLHETGAPEPLEVEAPSGSDLWAALLGSATPEALLLRIGLPASELPAYVQDQARLLNRGAFLADIANGLIYVTATFDSVDEAGTWLSSLRQPALAHEGYAAVMSTPAAYASEIERWGYQPQALDIMQKLKARWDPQGILIS